MRDPRPWAVQRIGRTTSWLHPLTAFIDIRLSFPDSFRLFPRCLGGRSFGGAGAAERVGNPLISFVARKLEERALDPGQLDLRCPGPGPGRGIVGGEFIDDLLHSRRLVYIMITLE